MADDRRLPDTPDELIDALEGVFAVRLLEDGRAKIKALQAELGEVREQLQAARERAILCGALGVGGRRGWRSVDRRADSD